MNKKITTIVAVVMVTSLLISTAMAGQEGLIETKSPEKKHVSVEEFQKKLKGNDDVRVIITLNSETTDKKIDDLQKKVGSFKVGKKGWTNAYPNGFAAEVKANQLEKLKKDPDVARIDADNLNYVQLETANYWSGATKARRPYTGTPSGGFGVDGNADGNADPRIYSKNDVVIAVVDTGIDPNHEDLTGLDDGGTAKIIGWYDAVNGYLTPYDDHGHGTHVSSIAAGEGDNNSRYKGVAPGAALVGVKVCNYYGGCWDSDIIEGFNWVIGNKTTYGIEIMTVSLGSYGSSDGTNPTAVAANNVYNNGIVVTIAAGNSGPGKYTIGSPGSAANAITVGAFGDPGYLIQRNLPAGVTAEDTDGLEPPASPEKIKSSPDTFVYPADNGFYIAPFSSRGPRAINNVLKPDVVAPGVAITAARASYVTAYHGGYVSMSGTSMATPFVAGVAALMLDANPLLTPAQVKSYIRSTAEDYGVSGCDIDYGCGRVRAFRAVDAASSLTGTDQVVPTHLRISDSFNDTAYPIRQYNIPVTSDQYYVASTMITPDYEPYSNSFGLAHYLFEPSGYGYAYWVYRQSTIVSSPDETGTYTAYAYRYYGSGRYTLDVSYK